MILTWDERKRVSNLDKHGLDFAVLSPEFFERAHIVPTRLHRFLAVATLDGVLITVVFAFLGSEAMSIISMRPASIKERAHAP